MKISYNWLKQFIKTDWTSEQTSELLTDLGLEVEVVEKYQSIKGGLEGVVVGHVLTCEKHPDADRLNVTTVNIGLEAPVQIVCGAAMLLPDKKFLLRQLELFYMIKKALNLLLKKVKFADRKATE